MTLAMTSVVIVRMGNEMECIAKDRYLFKCNVPTLNLEAYMMVVSVV